MRRVALLIAAFVLFAGLLRAASDASASSIAYTKDHNVWLSNLDGSGQHQVTHDGSDALAYEHPSQADDGTILTARGTRLYLLRQNGTQINSFDSVITANPYGAVGPMDPSLSPDGKTIAYGIGIFSGWHDYSTGITWTSDAEAVVYQRTSDGHPIGETMFYESPKWRPDSQNLLLWAPLNRSAPQAGFAPIGANHNDVQGWFTDYDTIPQGNYAQNVAPGDLTRAGDKLAALRIGNGETIELYSVSSTNALPVTACYNGQPNGGQFADVTWSPSGDQLSWAEGNGIWATHVGAVTPSGCDAFKDQHLIIPGGREPFIGPANVNPGAAGPGGGSGDKKAPKLSAKLRKKIKLSALLHGKLVITGKSNEAGTVSADLLMKAGAAKKLHLARALKITIAHGQKTLARPGKVKIRLSLRKAVGRRLMRAHGLKLTLRITATDQVGNASSKQQRVAVIR
jgi:hypothetical protein